jgi:hypothetical protein
MLTYWAGANCSIQHPRPAVGQILRQSVQWRRDGARGMEGLLQTIGLGC